MTDEQERKSAAGAEGSEPRGVGGTGRRYTAQEKLSFLEELKWSDESLRAFAARKGPTANTLIKCKRPAAAAAGAGFAGQPR